MLTSRLIKAVPVTITNSLSRYIAAVSSSYAAVIARRQKSSSEGEAGGKAVKVYEEPVAATNITSARSR